MTFGHGTAGPMGDFAGQLAAGQGDQTLSVIGWDRRLARLAGRITKKAIDTRVGKPPLPALDHRSTDTRKPSDLRDVQPIGRMQIQRLGTHVVAKRSLGRLTAEYDNLLYILRTEPIAVDADEADAGEIIMRAPLPDAELGLAAQSSG